MISSLRALTELTTPTPNIFEPAPGYKGGSKAAWPLPILQTTRMPWCSAIDSIPLVHQSSKGLPILAEIISYCEDDCQMKLGFLEYSIEMRNRIFIIQFCVGWLKLDEMISGRYPFEKINEAIASSDKGDVIRNVIIF